MRSTNSNWIILLIVASFAAGAVAQTRNRSLWDTIKNSAKQAGQNTAQQGAQQVQQGVQQGAGAVGNQINGGQQSPCGSLTDAAGGGAGGNLANAAFSGGGSNGASGAGSCGRNCFNAGPFAAAISQMTMSQQGGWHIIRMEVQFHNATNQPLAIAYHDGSMVMVDELGNTYQGAGGNPGEVQGMGIDRGNQTDSQFVLGPGQTSSAMFSVARYRPSTSAIGTAFNYNLTIDELQAQNGADAIVARQYNLNFPNLAPGSSGGAFPPVSPANSFAPAGGAAPGLANSGTGSGSTRSGAAAGGTHPQMLVPAVQRNAVNSRPGAATTTPTANPRLTQGAGGKAAMVSAAPTTGKPSAAKPVPAKTAATKAADNNKTTADK